MASPATWGARGGSSPGPLSVPQASCACGRGPGGTVTPFLGRGNGVLSPRGFLRAWLGAGQAPCWNLYLFVFILRSCPPPAPRLSCVAGQLLENHQGLGMSPRNHLVPPAPITHSIPGWAPAGRWHWGEQGLPLAPPPDGGV